MAETFLDRLQWHITQDQLSHQELYDEAQQLDLPAMVLKLLEEHVAESNLEHKLLLQKLDALR